VDAAVEKAFKLYSEGAKNQESFEHLSNHIEQQIKKELIVQENKLAFIVRSSVTNFKREKEEQIQEPPQFGPLAYLKAVRETLPSNGILIFFIFYFLWSISSTISSLWSKVESMNRPADPNM